jgi:hypothetical protein
MSDLQELNNILKMVMAELKKIPLRKDFNKLSRKEKEMFLLGNSLLNQFQDEIIIRIMEREKKGSPEIKNGVKTINT